MAARRRTNRHQPVAPALQSRWVFAAIAGLVALLYGRTAGYAFVNWDDPVLLIENPATKSLAPGALLELFRPVPGQTYQPLRVLAYAGQWKLFGTWAGGYHLVNACLHAIGTCFLFCAVRSMLRRLKPEQESKAQWAAAAVAVWFAVHAVNVEAVAWVSSLKYNLLGLFGFAAIWCYCRATENATNWRWMSGCLISLTLAMLSSPFALVLPGLLLLLEVCVPMWAGKTKELGAVFALWLIIGGVLVYCLIGGEQTIIVERAATTSASIPGALRSFAYYVAHTCLPVLLNNKYPNRIIAWSNWEALAGMALLLAMSASSALAWRRQERLPAFCIGWFLIGLALVSNLLQPLSTMMADRYLYLAGIGPLIFLCWLAVQLPLKVARVALALLLLTQAALGFARIRVWQDSETLWQDSLAKARDNALPLNCLAMHYESSGKPDLAGPLYQEATEVDPLYLNAQHRWGTWALNHGQLKAAQAALTACLENGMRTPEVLHNMGVCYHRMGDLQQARTYLEQAFAEDPTFADAELNLGIVYRLLEQWTRAEPLLDQARAKGSPTAHYEYGMMWYIRDHPERAMAAWRTVLDLEPNHVEAWHSIGVLHGAAGRITKAVSAFNRTLQLAPDHADAQRHLASAMNLLKQRQATQSGPSGKP